MLKNILKKILAILSMRVNLLDERLKQSEQITNENKLCLDAGKEIMKISNKYPSTYNDAIIIYEEWARGVLTECIPSSKNLREYARYCANPVLYRQWIKTQICSEDVRNYQLAP